MHEKIIGYEKPCLGSNHILFSSKRSRLDSTLAINPIRMNVSSFDYCKGESSKQFSLYSARQKRFVNFTKGRMRSCVHHVENILPVKLIAIST